MAKNREALLKKEVWEYDESCPGCKIDHLKESNPGIPFKLLFYVWIVVLCAALPISSLFPFLYFMIRDFHIAKREEDIGFYAGYVGSSFMFGRALTSVIWGMVADRYGLFSTRSLASAQMFGWHFLLRFLLGKFLWYTWPNEGTPLAYIRVLSKINMNCCVYVLRAWIYSMYWKDSALFRRLELGLMLGRFA
uniref:Protein zinc induced facilitator-like 1 n=1 Tax=Vitis vinifera TaxID=29760 RepID=A5CA71_VITVI|nr:hypothetical protein VITISV_031227 [Vitis vinifera]